MENLQKIKVARGGIHLAYPNKTLLCGDVRPKKSRMKILKNDEEVTCKHCLRALNKVKPKDLYEKTKIDTAKKSTFGFLVYNLLNVSSALLEVASNLENVAMEIKKG